MASKASPGLLAAIAEARRRTSQPRILERTGEGTHPRTALRSSAKAALSSRFGMVYQLLPREQIQALPRPAKAKSPAERRPSFINSTVLDATSRALLRSPLRHPGFRRETTPARRDFPTFSSGINPRKVALIDTHGARASLLDIRYGNGLYRLAIQRRSLGRATVMIETGSIHGGRSNTSALCTKIAACER
jgi:hypothetical protein